MKNSIRLFYLMLFLVSLVPYSLHCQTIKGGTVIYEQIVDYQLEGAYDDPRWDSYIAELPKQGKSYHLLHFTQAQALYEDDFSKKETPSEHLRTALEKVNYSKTPAPITKQIFSDFERKQKIQQMEFMTRSFLVKEPLAAKAWKLTAQKKKVLDYICMGAQLGEGAEAITAWFTPNIPISAGPGSYAGLPGLILGLEKNGDIFLLATKINLTPPEDELRSKLNKGQEISQSKFEVVVKEKQAAYWEDRKARDKSDSKAKSKKY